MSKKKAKKKRKKKKKPKFTALQLSFISEYLLDKNGAQALYRARGGTGTIQSAQVCASGYLSNPIISDEIARRFEIIYQNNSATAGQVIQELTRIGMLDVKTTLDDEGRQLPIKDWPPEARAALQSVEVDRGRRKIKFHPKAPALITLAKHFKLLTDKLEVTIKGGLAERMKAARKRAGK